MRYLDVLTKRAVTQTASDGTASLNRLLNWFKSPAADKFFGRKAQENLRLNQPVMYYQHLHNLWNPVIKGNK